MKPTREDFESVRKQFGWRKQGKKVLEISRTELEKYNSENKEPYKLPEGAVIIEDLVQP